MEGPASKRPFALKKPCANCPFRNDRPHYLARDRAQDIADALIQGSSFSCHKTLDYDVDEGPAARTEKTAFCAGALIVMAKDGTPNAMMQIGERLGLFQPGDLDMGAPVYDSLVEWVNGAEH